MKKLHKILSLIFIVTIICSTLSACSGLERESWTVDALVTNKEYIKAHNALKYTYDVLEEEYVWKNVHVSAKYKVTVQYDDYTETIDSKSLFESCEVDDNVEMKYAVYYNKEGEIVIRDLSQTTD